MKTIDKEFINGNKPTRSQRTFRMLCGFVLLVGLTMALAITAFSSTVSAATGIPGEEIAIQGSIGMTMAIVGILLIAVLLIWTKGEPLDSGMTTGFTIVAVLLIAAPAIMGVAVAFGGPITTETYCEKNPTDPSCEPTTPLRWDVQLAADLDAAGATYPASPMTVCDTAIGGTTGEWVSGDNGNVDLSTNMITTSVTIDTDLAYTAALWMEPNCIFIETSRVQLLEGPKASSGAIETQQYYAKIDSISLTGLSNDNDTSYTDVFYEDTDGRHHIGYQYEDGSWNEACPEYRGKDLPTSGCAPIVVGTDNGAGDTTGAIGSAGVRIFWVWEDRGPFSYRDTNGATWVLVFSIGSASDWHTFTFIATMTESSTDNS